jgi:hypothetical protein
LIKGDYMAEEYPAPPPPYLYIGQWSENGELDFRLTSDSSDAWKREFEGRWNAERKSREQTLSPLGEVRIASVPGGVRIAITEPMLNSVEWQAGLALKLMGILDRELNEP